MRFSACTLALVGAAALGADAQMPTSGTVKTTDMPYLNQAGPGTDGMFTVTHDGTNTKIVGSVTKLGDCTGGCGAHLHTGYDCTTAKGYFHYWDGADVADPWPASKVLSEKADSETSTLDTTTAYAGANFGEIAGRVVLLHDKGTFRTSCGKLVPDGLGATVLEADLKAAAATAGVRYASFAGEGFTADMAVSTAAVTVGEATTYTHTFAITGLDGAESSYVVGAPGTSCSSTAPEEDFVLEGSSIMELANTPVWLTVGENDAVCEMLLSKDTQGYLMLYKDGDNVKVSGHAIKLPMVGGADGVVSTAGMTATLYDGTCASPGAVSKKGDKVVLAKEFSSSGTLQGTPDNLNKDLKYPRAAFTSTLSGVSLSDVEEKAVVISYNDMMLACGSVSQLNEEATASPTSDAATAAVSAGVLAMTAAAGFTMM